jgi:hypothetical protein
VAVLGRHVAPVDHHCLSSQHLLRLPLFSLDVRFAGYAPPLVDFDVREYAMSRRVAAALLRMVKTGLPGFSGAYMSTDATKGLQVMAAATQAP